MDINDYQKQAHTTAVYPKEYAVEYLALKLASEAGEVAGKVGKVLRGDMEIGQARKGILEEIGDVLWYMAELTTALDGKLSDVANDNLWKLADRAERNVICGDGDNR